MQVNFTRKIKALLFTISVISVLLLAFICFKIYHIPKVPYKQLLETARKDDLYLSNFLYRGSDANYDYLSYNHAYIWGMATQWRKVARGELQIPKRMNYPLPINASISLNPYLPFTISEREWKTMLGSAIEGDWLYYVGSNQAFDYFYFRYRKSDRLYAIDKSIISISSPIDFPSDQSKWIPYEDIISPQEITAESLKQYIMTSDRQPTVFYVGSNAKFDFFRINYRIRSLDSQGIAEIFRVERSSQLLVPSRFNASFPYITGERFDPLLFGAEK